MKDKSIDGPGTALPWIFDRMESAVEFAELKGETLEEHEGYFRSNDGRWIITYRGEDDEPGGQICEVAFKGKAKRGEAWNAPDPVGQANARYIVWSANNAPALVEALQEAKLQLEYMDERSPSGTTPIVLARIHAVLSTALGEMNDE